MSETLTLDHTVRKGANELAWGAGVVAATAGAVWETGRQPDNENGREGAIDVFVYAARVRANEAARQVLRRWGPKRFRN